MSDATSAPRSDCPISYALEIFGDRWTLLVLRDLLFRSRHRYRELLDCEERIATNVLADRLKRLEARGLIRKCQDPTDGRQFVYLPAPAAIAVVPVLVEMAAWGMRNGTMTEVNGDFLEFFDTDREALIAELQAKVRDAAGEALA